MFVKYKHPKRYNRTPGIGFDEMEKIEPYSLTAKLFAILDEIDTAKRAFVPDENSSYYRHVQEQLNEAHKLVVSDGYELYRRGDTPND